MRQNTFNNEFKDDENNFGALAQLGERNTGSVEVSGSIPLGSTILEPSLRLEWGFFYAPNYGWRLCAEIYVVAVPLNRALEHFDTIQYLSVGFFRCFSGGFL